MVNLLSKKQSRLHEAENGFSGIIQIPVDSKELEATWVMPAEAEGIVLFAHGSGSSRHRWSRGDPRLAPLAVGYFGGSTGAAAALVAAARLPGLVGAVVARGGRVDLAADVLPAVAVPTLLIVGGHDHVVLDLNQRALAQLAGERELLVVPGALEQVAAGRHA